MRTTPPFPRWLAWLVSPIFWATFLPPFLFFGWMLWSGQIIGNDYRYPVQHLQNFQAFREWNIFPMWYPHLTGGVPSGTFVFAQISHLPAWILAHLPWFWTGHVVTLVTVLHLLQFFVGHLGTYFLVRRLTALTAPAAYFLAFLSVYNLRSLDSLRYGTAIDGYVYAQLLVLLALNYLKRPSLGILVGCGIAAQFLFTCGYQPMIIFGATGGLFCVLVFLAYVREARVDLARKLGALALATVSALLLSAPNWLALSEWMGVNAKRMQAPELAWANFCPMIRVDFFLNFFRPWSVEVHSGFGGSSLLGLVFCVVVLLALFRLKRYWLLLPLLAFPYAYAAGADGPVFTFFFEYVPLYKNIRVPGRLLSIAPTLLLAAVACLRPREKKEATDFDAEVRRAARFSALANGAILLVMVAYQIKFPGNGWRGKPLHHLSPENLVAVWDFWRQMSWILLGLVATVAFWFSVDGLNLRVRRFALAALALATFAQTALILRHSTWLEEARPTWALEDFEKANHLQLYGDWPLIAVNTLEESTYGSATIPYTNFIKSAGANASCYLPVDAEVREKSGVLLPFYLSDQTICRKNQAEVFEYLGTKGCPSGAGAVTLLREDAPGGCALKASEGERGSGAALASLNQANRLVTLTPNILALETNTERDSVLVTPFPFATTNWRALVDGAEQPLVETNGAFVGVRVPAGNHLVRIEYFSQRFLLAYRIAFGTALALALLAAVMVTTRIRRRPWKQAVFPAILLVLVLTGAYAFWESRLVQDARREVLLHNNYPALLERQLTRWRTAGISG